MTTRHNALSAGLINPRLWKELRLLWLPGAMAAVAMCLVPVFALFEVHTVGEGIFSLLKGFSWLAFLGCLLLIGSAPFGWEFQHRTMPLLLTQPFSRSRLWQDKLLAAALWTVLVCVVGWLLQWVLLKAFLPESSLLTRDLFGGARAAEARRFIETDLVFVLLFAPATVCAAPMWTMSARSTVGGVTFTAASHFMAALVAHGIAEKAHLPEGVVFVLAAVLYPVFFLWLGWRVFAQLQVTDGTALADADSELRASIGTPSWRQRVRRSWLGRMFEAAWLDRALRCAPAGATANLFRKELRLQKPLYQVGAFFVLCWVGISLLVLIQPGKGYQNLFDILIAFHVPLAFLLAGSLSISDEHTLGISGWHLTFPVPAGRQWAVKLISSLTAGVAVGWALPLVCLCASGLAAGYSTRWALGQPGLFLLCASGMLFVMSFWSVTLVGNTVRAVLVALLGLTALFFAFMLAHWWARSNGGFSATVALSLQALAGAPPGSAGRYLTAAEPYVIGGWLVALAGFALAQTLWFFRRPDAVHKPLIACLGVLLLGALIMGVVAGDLALGADILGAQQRRSEAVRH